MLDYFAKPGKASFIVGGQWGSEAKGAAAAYLAQWHNFNDHKAGFAIATTNAGAQAGHTSTVNGETTVVFHLPTYSLYRDCLTYINAGAIVDTRVLEQELQANPRILKNGLVIHPNAVIIGQEDKEAEGRASSRQTQIASTRKGVGHALSRKVLREAMTFGSSALHKPLFDEWHPHIAQARIERLDLNGMMLDGHSVLVEVPQGIHLSVDSQFYPHTTSRNCTVSAAMSDAGIHPHFYHRSMLVVRTFPIRVGNIYDNGDNPQQIGYSGDCFPDQQETSWGAVGVKPEITTVTKRIRRVFTFSEIQVAQAIALTRPNVIYLSFCDYLPGHRFTVSAERPEPDEGRGTTVVDMIETLKRLSYRYGRRGEPVEILTGWGPSTDDVKPATEFME